MSAARGPLEAALRNAWVAELEASWRQFDLDYLGGALRKPQIVVLDTAATVGRWDRETRTIGIAARHVLEAPWRVVLETLRHEMAHQYADEVLGADETPHGPLFRRACELLRVSPRTQVTADGTPPGEPPDRARLLRRIEKLLSLADSPNENEADAAFRKAHRLLVEHGVELRGTDPEFAVRDLGPLKRRHQTWEFTLANILERFFGVEVIWSHGFDARTGRGGTVLRAYGVDAALELAEYVYAFLTGLLERLWIDYRARRGLRGDRDRQRYWHGVLQGFLQRLCADQRAMREEEGLIVVADPALRAFVRHHVPHVRTLQRGGAPRTRAHADGEQDGRAIVISKPLTGSGAHGGLLEG